MKRSIFILSLGLAGLAACETSDTDKPPVPADPRQGAEVSRICFTSQIRSWSSLDSRSIIVEASRDKSYRLELIGACRPDDAFLSIGLISRGGGSCLTRGDSLVTDTRYTGGPCSITRLYEWTPDAGKPAPVGGAKSDS
jgi:hypothetical protein